MIGYDMLEAALIIAGPFAGFAVAFLVLVPLVTKFISENMTLKQRIAKLMEITPRRMPNGRFAKR